MYVSDPDTQVALVGTSVLDTQTGANGVGLGVEVIGSATLSADGCLIDGNMEAGMLATGSGTQIILRDTTVRDTQPNTKGEFGEGIVVNDGATLSADGCFIDGNMEAGMIATGPGTQVTLRDTTVRNTQPNTNGDGWGTLVNYGAILSGERCLVDGNVRGGLSVSCPGTQVTLRDTTVSDTQPDANGEGGLGIQVSDGATLSAEGCLVDGNMEVGILVGEDSTKVTLQETQISRTSPGTGMTDSTALGVAVQEGALLTATRLVVGSNQGPGILINTDGAMNCDRCTIRDNQFAGTVVVNGGVLAIIDSTIEGTTPSINLGGGVGVYAWPWLQGPPNVVLTNTLIQDNPIAGVWLIGDGAYVLTGNTISGGSGEPFGSGSRCGDSILARDGVTAWDGTSGLLLQDNLFLDAEGSGLFLDGSSALMSGNTYSGNAMDLVVQNQSCDSIPSSYSEAPHRDLCPLYSYPTCYAEFFFVAMPAAPVDWEED